jgi:hypothetical protein
MKEQSCGQKITPDPKIEPEKKRKRKLPNCAPITPYLSLTNEEKTQKHPLVTPPVCF